MKISSEELIRIYNLTQSIKKTSKICNMTSSGVTWRLKKLNQFKKEWCKKKNDYKRLENTIILYTSNREEILVDEEDFEHIRKYKWCVSKTGYAVANIKKKVTKLHRFILNIKDQNIIIDHKNRNKLDNRKSNLRICTAWENCTNSSNTKGKELPLGISKTQNGKYRARIMVHRKEINLGRFEKLEDAVEARLEGEKKYFNGFRYSHNPRIEINIEKSY